jgi:hypothetical protein
MAFPQKKSTSSDFRRISHLLQSKLGLLAYPLDNAARTGAVATNFARAEANAPNLARALWNVVMELAYGCLTAKRLNVATLNCHYCH